MGTAEPYCYSASALDGASACASASASASASISASAVPCLRLFKLEVIWPPGKGEGCATQYSCSSLICPPVKGRLNWTTNIQHISSTKVKLNPREKGLECCAIKKGSSKVY